MKLTVENMPKLDRNRNFRLGDRVVVQDLSGIDSRETAIVVNHFDWKLEAGAYKAPGRSEIPIRIESTGALRYMYRNRLIHLT